MEFAVSLTYNKALLRSAVLLYWRRTFGWILPTAVLFMLTFVIYSIVNSVFTSTIGFLLGIVSLLMVMMAASVVTSYQKSMLMASANVELKFTESKLIASSSLGYGEVPWSRFNRLDQSNDVWLLVFSDAGWLTLPIMQISPDCSEFIKQRVVASGGKVTG